MTIRQDRLAFVVLVCAFAVSALYQAYRALLMEVPEYDAFGVVTALGYVISVGISAFVLTGRRWAWWTVSALVLVLLAIGVFWYYPVVAVSRIESGAMGPAGWLEGSIYMGLLFVAGSICALNLAGARLVPGDD
jgi:hypothetical protein